MISAAEYDILRTAKPTLVDDLLNGLAWDDVLAQAVETRSKSPSRGVVD